MASTILNLSKAIFNIFFNLVVARYLFFQVLHQLIVLLSKIIKT